MPRRPLVQVVFTQPVDGLVHIADGLVIFLALGIETAAAYVSLGLETVELYGLVVVIYRLGGVTEEEIAGSPVQICGRILRLLADVSVEIRHGIFEALRQEVCHSPAEIQTDETRTEIYCLLEIRQSLVVPAEAAVCDGPVMISVGKHRVEAHGGVEILLGTTDVTEIVFGDATVEISPVVCGIQTRQDVELLYGLGISSVCKGVPSPEREHVLVILCKTCLAP